MSRAASVSICGLGAIYAKEQLLVGVFKLFEDESHLALDSLHARILLSFVQTYLRLESLKLVDGFSLSFLRVLKQAPKV